MDDSKSNRDCRVFARAILDLANGEIPTGASPDLEGHLASCAACRERLASDRQDRAARDAAWEAGRFPPGRGAAFWEELERRAAPGSRGAWRRRVVATAASFLILAGGIGLGALAGPWVKRWMGRAEAPAAPVPPAAREAAHPHGAGSAEADAPGGGIRYAWPELRLVSGGEGGF